MLSPNPQPCSSPFIYTKSLYGPGTTYARPVPGSASSTSDTFADERWFSFDVPAEGLAKGLEDANARFNTTLSTDPARYAMGHFNVENEGTLGVSAGASIRGFNIQVCPAAACQ